MKKYVIFTVLLSFALLSFGQEYKYVDVNTLNIREGEGKDYNTIGKCYKGDKVTVISENNGWAKIETESGTKGFVAATYLSSKIESVNSSNGQEDSSNSGSNGGLIIFLAIVLWVTYKIISSGYKKKCDNCKKWFAMKKTGRECVATQQSTITKERKHKNSKGEVISTWEEFVPATVYYYHTHRKCKHCGYKDYLTSNEKREN